MASDNTEVNQVNVLIEQKEAEIDDLKDLRTQFENDDYESPTTAAEVAADPDASSAERAAAAIATTGQDPATVNAAQSEPSPSTDADAFASKDEVEAAQEEQAKEGEEIKEQAEKDEENAPETATTQGVELPDGRGDVNKLGDPETQGFGTNPESEAANAEVSEEDAKTGEADESKSGDTKDASDESKEKAAETNANIASVATTGKTDEKTKPKGKSFKKD